FKRVVAVRIAAGQPEHERGSQISHPHHGSPFLVLPDVNHFMVVCQVQTGFRLAEDRVTEREGDRRLAKRQVADKPCDKSPMKLNRASPNPSATTRGQPECSEQEAYHRVG